MGKKKVRPSGLILRGQTYYFRLDLPSDVRTQLGRTAVWESLETSDYDRAIAAWGPKHSEWKRKIADARSGTLRTIKDRAAWDIATGLIEYVDHDMPSRYRNSGEPLTLAGIAQMVQEDLDQRGTVYDDDGLPYRLADLTPADRLAVVQAVQEQVFCQLNGIAIDQHRRAASTAELARAIKPVDAKVSSTVPRLMDAFEDWKKAKNPRPKSEVEFEAACQDFISVVGNLPLKDMTKHDFVKYKKHLLEAKKAGGGTISQSTRVKRFGAVKAVIAVAVENLEIEAHPGDGVVMGRAPKSALRTNGWLDDEIEALFEGPVHREGERPRGGGGEASYWLPIIAFHSGARLSELAQLNVADIVTQESVRCFRVIDDPEGGQTVKNEVSRRLVPIHKRIIDLGFFDYVDTLDPAGRLFPLVRPDSHGVAGGLFSKFFGKYRKGLGITRRGADFHATRHHVKSMLRSIPGDDEMKVAITGHSNGNVSFNYGKFSPREMKKIVDQIQYDVRIPKWKPGKVLRKAA